MSGPAEAGAPDAAREPAARRGRFDAPLADSPAAKRSGRPPRRRGRSEASALSSVFGRVVLSFACVLAVAATSFAADIDLSAVRSRIDEGIAASQSDPPLRRAYEKLAARLDRADAPGLADDFAKLDAVARAVRGPLDADAALRAAMDFALREGESLLDDDESDAALAVAESLSPKAVRRGDRTILRGRDESDHAEVLRRDDRYADACAASIRAAGHFADARRAAGRSARSVDRGTPRWHTALSNMGGELLSVWSAPGEVFPLYVCGAADAEGGIFLRGAPEGFVRIPTGKDEDFWWTTGIPGDGVWAVGTNGACVVYDPATGDVTDRPTGVASTLYGVWGASASEVWAVGVGPQSSGLRPTLLRWDGQAWAPALVPPTAEGAALYKVWGTAADDVWACGTLGVLLHFDGVAWTHVPSGTSSTLLTVHGASPRIAVGEVLTAHVVERNDRPGAVGSWQEVALPPDARSAAGVFVPERGDAWACGYFGTVMRRTARGWKLVTDAPAGTGIDLHAVHVDGAGGVWIAGGDIFDGGSGTLLYRGPRTPPTTIVPQARFAEDVAPMLYANCAYTGCHIQPFVLPDLETPESALATAVARPSIQSALLFVTPGRPSRSYLWHKILGTQEQVDGFGDRMPQGEDPLAPADLELVRAWILEGAPR
ncbi:MAG: hypothetical protein HMLKMBBP_00567 [Planctomycetes bacterium]|nr:hypothetical protein [Planctomycetota bacterium]